MAQLKSDFIEAAGREREVTLTTFGRKSGKEHRVTIWIVTDGSRVYIRSGQGFRRHWPQNLMARKQGGLRLGTRTIKVEPRHVTDPAEARATSALYGPKYGASVKPSKPDQPLTPGEQASFELIPIET